jgi:pilus assembly protein CpaB
MNSTLIRPATPGWGPRLRIAALLALVLACGATAVIGAKAYIEAELGRQRAALAPRPVNTLQVVVAKYALEQGEPIGADNMALRDLPADHLPGSAVRPAQFDALLGLRLIRPMKSGEPLLREALVQPEPEPLATRLPAGKRAVTVVVDEVNSVSGMLRPGDRIDLLLTARDPMLAGQAAAADLTRPLLQDLRILATGGRLEARREAAATPLPFGTITVEVTPDQAKMLVLAQRGGRLTALLRGPDDRLPMSASTLEFNDLIGRARPAEPAPVPVAPPRPVTEMIIGGVGRAFSATAPRLDGSSSVPAAGPEMTIGRPVDPPSLPSRGPAPSGATSAWTSGGSLMGASPLASVAQVTSVLPAASTASAGGHSAGDAARVGLVPAVTPAVQPVIDTPWGRLNPVAAEPLLIR